MAAGSAGTSIMKRMSSKNHFSIISITRFIHGDLPKIVSKSIYSYK